MVTFHKWDQTINGVDINIDALYNDNQVEYETNIASSENTYQQMNAMFSTWNNTIGGIGGIDTFYKNNQMEYGIENQIESESNFIMNSGGAYQGGFQANEANVPFREWNCVDNTFNEPNNNNQAKFDVNIGMVFRDWDHAMNEITKFEKREEFKVKDPKKKTTTKRIGCIWQINLSCPEKDNSHKLVYIAKLINEHRNHELDQEHYNFQKNIAFTTEMTEDVKFFVIQRFRPKLCNQSNDASQLYKDLLSKKEVDPWYSITIFEYRWKCLLEKYNNEHVVNYLQRLYTNKDSWAKAFRLIFNSNTTLLELAEKLTACILEEDKKMEYTLFCASVPKAALVATADTILPNVCRMLRKYLTIEILTIQEDQIKQSLQYHAAIVVPDELQRYHS
ncbi:2228_t:CDS:2, partial [Gigaspora margarita]